MKIQPSIISYIAKGIALVGKGERYKGYQACDIAFEHFHASRVSFLLLIKACIQRTSAWLPSNSDICLGYSRVYGRRARRRDISRR